MNLAFHVTVMVIEKIVVHQNHMNKSKYIFKDYPSSKIHFERERESESYKFVTLISFICHSLIFYNLVCVCVIVVSKQKLNPYSNRSPIFERFTWTMRKKKFLGVTFDAQWPWWPLPFICLQIVVVKWKKHLLLIYIAMSATFVSFQLHLYNFFFRKWILIWFSFMQMFNIFNQMF